LYKDIIACTTENVNKNRLPCEHRQTTTGHYWPQLSACSFNLTLTSVDRSSIVISLTGPVWHYSSGHTTPALARTVVFTSPSCVY